MRITQNRTTPCAAVVIAALALSLSACGGDSSNSGTSQTPEDAFAVSATSPVDTAVGVGTNSAVTASFNETVNADTLDTASFTVGAAGVTPMTGTVTLDTTTNTGVFRAAGGDFSANTEYQATITTAVASATGKTLTSDYQWSFTTGAGADNVAPTATSTDPLNGAIDVAINRPLTANFDEAMFAPSINSSTFTLTDAASEPVAGTVSLAGTTALFNPTSDLVANASYTATLSTGMTDLADNALAADVVWTFTTGADTADGPAPVVLGTAANYVILAKAGISTTGTTAITGDIAVSPIDETAITGFSLTRDGSDTFATSDLVNGRIYAADQAAPTPVMLTTAISDMETAYVDAAGRSNPDSTELGAGDISGLTLEPGLYKWGTGLLIASDVTLSGSANDVWILQIAQDLTVSNGVSITLAGGALAKNVFWQVAGSVTFGTTSDIKGIVLSKTGIDLQTGADLEGRALAQTAVTLDASTVFEPTE